MARGDYPSAKQDQYMLRFPDGMRDRLRTEAERNGRSMNAEIVARLATSLGEADLSGTLIDLASDYRRVSERLNVVLPIILHLSEDEIKSLQERKELMDLYNKLSKEKEGK